VPLDTPVTGSQSRKLGCCFTANAATDIFFLHSKARNRKEAAVFQKKFIRRRKRQIGNDAKAFLKLFRGICRTEKFYEIIGFYEISLSEQKRKNSRKQKLTAAAY